MGAVLFVRSCAGQRDAEWQARVERELARSEQVMEENAALREQAEIIEARADSLADEAGRRDTVIVRMVEELPAPPADCEPFTAPRDSVIAEMQERHEDISAAFEAEREAAARLRLAEIRARAVADSLTSVLGDRPRPLSPLIPKVGLGATAGICTTGVPCAAFGLTLSWEVNLF